MTDLATILNTLTVNPLETTLFLLMAASLLITALLAVYSKQIAHSVFWLATFLVLVALTFLWSLQSEYIAFIQLIVYAGGIVVLLLFAVMITGKVSEYPKHPTVDDPKLAFLRDALLGILFVMFITLALSSSDFSILDGEQRAEAVSFFSQDSQSAILEVVRSFLIDYGLLAMLLSLTLLTAMLGAVHLVKKKPGEVLEKVISGIDPDELEEQVDLEAVVLEPGTDPLHEAEESTP